MNRPTTICMARPKRSAPIATPRRPMRISALLLAAFTAPAFAHVTSSGAPHAHGSDVSGLIAVVALVAIAAWIDRRQR